MARPENVMAQCATRTLPKNVADIPVAIYIPTYNRVGVLEIALRSALGQTHPNVHVYVSDNASDDATPDLCANFQSFPNFTYMRSPANLGGATNLTKLLGCSSEPWFVILGDDDYLDLDFVEKTLKFALENSCTSVVGSAINYVYGKELHRDVPFFLGDKDPLLRLFCFHHTPNTNAIFYGIRRRREIMMLEGVPGVDWIDTIANIAAGNIGVIESTYLHREMTKWLSQEDIANTDMYQNYLSNCGYSKYMLKNYDKTFKIAEILYRYYITIYKAYPVALTRAFLYLIFCVEWWKSRPEAKCQKPDIAAFFKEVMLEARQQDSRPLSRFKAVAKCLFDWRKGPAGPEGALVGPGPSASLPDGRLTIWQDLLQKAHRQLYFGDAGGVFNAAYVAMATYVLQSGCPPPCPPWENSSAGLRSF